MQRGVRRQHAQPQGHTSHFPTVQRARPVRGEVQWVALSANNAAPAGLFGQSMLRLEPMLCPMAIYASPGTYRVPTAALRVPTGVVPM